MKWLFLIAFINILFVFNASCELTSWRLPNTTTPIDYNIFITVESKIPHQINEVFSGRVDIRINVIEETKDLYLHSKFANISEVVLTDVNNQQISVDFKLVPERELLHVFTENLIGKAEYIVKIAYISELRRDKLGFHLSSYVNAAGQKVYVFCCLFWKFFLSWTLNFRDIAVTQFAPTESRHAFPCFDEPRFKARFIVSVAHPQEYHVLGNMDIVSIEKV